MVCPKCQADLPNDAHYCIECGADVQPHAEPAIGATVQLAEAKDIKRCLGCGSANPTHANFCVLCGRALDEVQLPVPTRAPAPRPAPVPATPPVTSSPRYGQSMPRRARHAGRSAGTMNWDRFTPLLFFGGLAVLFMTRSWWPGILILLGVTGFSSNLGRGRARDAVATLVWMFGMALLFLIPKLFFPGILVLVGITAMVRALWR